MDAVEAFQECLLLVASILTLAYIGPLTFGAALSDCLFKILNRIYDLIAMPAVHMPLVRISMGVIVMGLLLFAVQSVVFCFQLFFCRDPDEAPVNSAKRPLYEQQLLTLSWNVQKTTNIEESRAWRIPLPLINEEEINRLADTAVNTTVHNRYSIGDSIEWTSRLPATGPSVDASSMAQRNTKPSTSPGRTFTFPLYEDDDADESEEEAKESTSICCESEGDFRGLDAIRRACELGDMHRDERIEGDDLEGLIAHFQRQLKEYDTVGVLIQVAYDAVRNEDFDGGSDSEIDLDEIRDLGALQEKYKEGGFPDDAAIRHACKLGNLARGTGRMDDGKLDLSIEEVWRMIGVGESMYEWIEIAYFRIRDRNNHGAQTPIGVTEPGSSHSQGGDDGSNQSRDWFPGKAIREACLLGNRHRYHKTGHAYDVEWVAPR